MMAGGETAREAAERGIAMIDHMLGLRAACLRELPAARAGHPDAVEDLRSCLRELRLLGIGGQRLMELLSEHGSSEEV